VLLIYRPGYYIGMSEPDEGTPAHDQWQQSLDDAADRIDFICPKKRHARGNVTVRGRFLGDFQAVR
jgi:replicative DNA helicase